MYFFYQSILLFLKARFNENITQWTTQLFFYSSFIKFNERKFPLIKLIHIRKIYRGNLFKINKFNLEFLTTNIIFKKNSKNVKNQQSLKSYYLDLLMDDKTINNTKIILRWRLITRLNSFGFASKQNYRLRIKWENLLKPWLSEGYLHSAWKGFSSNFGCFLAFK